jgi:uncharacterized protein
MRINPAKLTQKMKIYITLISVAIASILLVTSSKILAKINITFHENIFLDEMFKYQLFAFIIAFILLMITLKISPESKGLLKFGNIQNIAFKEKWLGINGISTWQKNGLQLLFFISVPTAIFMFLGVYYTNSFHNFRMYFIPLILLFSITNSFSEEIIYRFVINGNLAKIVASTTIFLISGIIFGLPHYWGFPTGIIGVIMSGLLGYILSKATHETQGLGIAWGIHFVQDVIIFTAVLMMNVK